MTMIMNDNKIIEYIDTVMWEDVEKLPHTLNRVYLDGLEEYDDDYENSSYLYLTIFSGFNENGSDRYLGSDTASTTKSFMSTNYTGSVKKRKIEFDESMASFDHRVLCLKVGEDGDILKSESECLKGIDARKDERFFNSSNVSGGVKKTLHNQIQLYIQITNGITDGFRTAKEDVETLYNMRRAQPRMFDLDESHVSRIEKDILGFHGKDLEKYMRPTILLEDYYGPGKHKRGGNTHTIEAVYRPSLRHKVKELKVVFVPKELWSKCTENTLKDILRWDNAKRQKISSMHTDEEEIIDSCFRLIVDFNLSHTDEKVKERAYSLGATPSDWDRVRPKLKEKLYQKNTLDDIPDDMDIIHYPPAKVRKIEEEKSTENTDCMMLSTVQSGNSFNWVERIVKWLVDPSNEKRRLHGEFYHGEKSHVKYFDAWPERKKEIVPLITSLFEKCGKKGHFTYQDAPRLEPKKNKIHDKEAA